MHCGSTCIKCSAQSEGISTPCTFPLKPTDQHFQKWTGEFFILISLFSLGALYQLGHCVGEPSPMPSQPVKLTLFDISSVTTIRIKYCNCRKPHVPTPHHVQHLHICWFPATFKQPGTAFTFHLLDFLHQLQTRSKITLYDFYAALVSSDNPCGLKPTIVSALLIFDLDTENFLVLL